MARNIRPFGITEGPFGLTKGAGISHEMQKRSTAFDSDVTVAVSGCF